MHLLLFLSDEGPMLETLDYTIHYRQYTDLFISEHCLRSTLRVLDGKRRLLDHFISDMFQKYI